MKRVELSIGDLALSYLIFTKHMPIGQTLYEWIRQCHQCVFAGDGLEKVTVLAIQYLNFHFFFFSTVAVYMLARGLPHF